MGTLTSPELPARAFRDLADALAFFTRLPRLGAPSAVGSPFAFARFAWAAPLAGAVVGLIGALAGEAGALLALQPNLRAVFAVAAMVLATGALHEDGFADCADGFGGGRDREAKLAIMRDSRLGTYGVCALVLALIAKVSMTTILLRAGFAWGAAGLVVACAGGRVAALAPMALLGPARREGAGADAGRLPMEALVGAGGAFIALAVVFGVWSFGVIEALFAGLLAGAAGFGAARLAQRQIGGQTGDVAGAAALAGELAALVGLLIAWRGP